MAVQKRLLVKTGLDNNNQTITNVANPVASTDAVNKQSLELSGSFSSYILMGYEE